MNLEKLKKKHAKEIREAHLESSIFETIGTTQKPRHIYVHDDYVSVSYETENFPSSFSVGDAIEIMRWWEPFIILAEHWQDSCVSVSPAQLIEKRYKKNGKLVFKSYAELCHADGRGYGPLGEIVTNYSHQKLSFWAEIAGRVRGGKTILNVDIKANIPRGGKTDLTRRWYAPEPSSRRSEYWASLESFDSWAEMAAEAKA